MALKGNFWDFRVHLKVFINQNIFYHEDFHLKVLKVEVHLTVKDFEVNTKMFNVVCMYFEVQEADSTILEVMFYGVNV